MCIYLHVCDVCLCMSVCMYVFLWECVCMSVSFVVYVCVWGIIVCVGICVCVEYNCVEEYIRVSGL